MAGAFRPGSVSPPRSSNRTCGFPASGSPTGFTSRHTADGQCRLVFRDDTLARGQPSPCGRAPSEAFRSHWCCQAHRQSPSLGFFTSAPEVRALSSAGITRPQRSYGPVRLPSGPPCSPRRWRRDLQPKRASPDYPDHLPNVPCPLPRWIGTGAYVGFDPTRTSCSPRCALLPSHTQLHPAAIRPLTARFRWSWRGANNGLLYRRGVLLFCSRFSRQRSATFMFAQNQPQNLLRRK